jgi:D-alanyl-lipoteichoic acid acyltransferase DltB (MBOAT superfamily)
LDDERLRPAGDRVIFNSALFVWFYCAVFAAYFGLARGREAKLWVLLGANLVFFATWNAAFIPCMLATGAADFFLARAIAAEGAGARRKLLLVSASVLLNAGVFVFFRGAGAGGWVYGTVLTVGVSFYVFQSMSYTLDVYRGVFVPRGDLLEFLSSLTFFPHLLAGPVVRSAQLLPQFERPREPERADFERALALILVGLTKKTLADLIAPTVDRVFAYGSPAALQSWTAVLGFAAQMYGDFSGYTDMATGLALMLGYELPPNFDLPYLSASPIEFWRRWHMSLSTWFRDYLYYPLAVGPLRAWPAACLVVVMAVAGIWHGFAANYLAFGLYHGALLAATFWLSRRGAGGPRSRLAGIAATFYLVLVGFVIFRSPSWEEFRGVFLGLHFLGPAGHGGPRDVALLIAAAGFLAAGHALDDAFLRRRWLSDRPVLLRLAATAAAAFAFVAGTRPTFIYFRF